MDVTELSVNEEYGAFRLDKFICENLKDRSRSYIQGLIEQGEVKVNSKTAKSNHKLKIGDLVVVNIPDPIKLQLIAENLDLDVLYEDEDLIVVNKPQGMVVHPAAGNYSGTLVNALLNHCKDLSGINGVMRPGIVHRIDKDTTGTLVVAKNDYAHNMLSEQLKNHSMKRIYLALVEGVIKDDEGTINAPLGRHHNDRIKFAVTTNGKHAVTHYSVLERFNNCSLIECRLETGRTHQIRVHMAYIGHPLVGDPVYGLKKQKYKLEGQLLHAKVLGFVHPRSEKFLQFESPLPNHFLKVLNSLRK